MRQNRRTLQKMIVVIFMITVLMTGGCEKKDAAVSLMEVSAGDEESAEETEEETAPEEIYVYVCGEVRNPGVYKLESGNRITHALFAAGGMTDQAADTYLNQAEVLEDGQKIYVPDKEEVQTMNQEMAAGESAVSDGKININTADKAQLTQLSGIGESRAAAIISYRETNGAFKNIEEIKNIDGIKDGIFEKIKDQIKVE